MFDWSQDWLRHSVFATTESTFMKKLTKVV